MAVPAEHRPRQSLLRWQIVTAGVGLAVVAAFLLQSAGSYRTVLVAAGGGTYVEAIVGGPRYINPLLAQANQVDSSIASLVFSGLTSVDECGNVIPDLAKSWTVSGDGRRYTFDLRDDAFWHDGVPVVAEDVVYTISVLQSPDYTAAPSIAPLWREVTATALDSHTVAIDLPEAYGPFISYTNIGILPAHVLAGVPVSTLTELDFNRMPIGSGPFSVVESDSAHVLLRAATAYYGEHPYIEAIEFRFYRDLGEALRAHQNGQVQGIAGVTAEYMPEVAASGNLSVYSGTLARLSIILLNLKSASAPYLEERSVRHALMLGLDRSAIVSDVLEGRGLVAHAPFSSCSWALDPNGSIYEYDPVQAKSLLEAAGWSDHDGDGTRDKDGHSLALRLVVQDERNNRAVADEVARQWARIGVRTEVVPLPFLELVESQLETRLFDAALVDMSLEGDPDPYVFWHSSQAQAGGQNYSSFVDQEADGLLESARREWDVAKRQQMYQRFQEIFSQELPALPLYYPVYSYVVDSSVGGVRLGPMNRPEERFRNLAEWYVNSRRLRVREGGIDTAD